MNQEAVSVGWDDVFVPNYGTPAISLHHGDGSYVWDTDGRRYLDLLGGIAVSILGHGHHGLAQAVSDQAHQLMHTSNLYANPPALELATRLHQLTDLRTFLCNSGTEANEAALKLLRQKAHAEGRSDAVVLAFTGSFHGRTAGSLALTGQPKHQQGCGPLPGQIVHVAPEAEAIRDAVAQHDVVGIFYEPIQGEGGIHPLSPDTVQALRDAQQGGVVLVADEVQAGCGRTGTFLASEGLGLRPDVVTLAKALGGGMPIGAMLCTDDLATRLGPGTHGSTFGGNPVSCAAALVVLDALPALMQRATRLGEEFTQRATEAGLAVRGAGLLLGVEATGKAGQVVQTMCAQGVLVGQAGPDTVRLAPPLNVPESDWLATVTRLVDAIQDA